MLVREIQYVKIQFKFRTVKIVIRTAERGNLPATQIKKVRYVCGRLG